MTILKTPCPACGQMPEIVWQGTIREPEFFIHCKNPECRMTIETIFFPSENGAIAAWEAAFGKKQPGGDLVGAVCVMDTDGRYGIAGGNIDFDGEPALPLAEIRENLLENLREEEGFSADARAVNVLVRVPRPTVQEIKGEIE